MFVRYLALVLSVLFVFFPSTSLADEPVSCFTQESGDSDKQSFFEPWGSGLSEHLKNRGFECALVSDVNLKTEAGLTLKKQPFLAQLDLEDCMKKAGCYVPGGGTYTNDRCMAELCKCNKKMVRERIVCGGSEKGYDCEEIKKALESGGGAMLFKRNAEKNLVLGSSAITDGSLSETVMLTREADALYLGKK